jgi:3-deoxy-manno-octulosonate cytidylyltransferase (CMP-KDO synthetase)
MLQFAGIIPARYASTRFPGKPLVMIKGKTMIERVYRQASKVLTDVAVATDDPRIEADVLRFGGNVIMTSPNHQSGTDRCAEALAKFEKQLAKKFDVVINIQGDEPFIQPAQLEKLMGCFLEPKTQIATLAKPIETTADLLNPNHVKVIVDPAKKAIYFSRSPIPYFRNKPQDEWVKSQTYLKHIGIYAYRADALIKITKLQQSPLELIESLEQLRWIENGYTIAVETTPFESISVDTPDDLDKILQLDWTD